jgi:PPOX class probable FMN-dependent enzyme
MPFEQFTHRVASIEELTTLVGGPSELALKKELNYLDEHMRRFIAHSPLVILSTHDEVGRCDASPRGDAPGFVRVLDERTLLIPDRRGNRRFDSLRNVLATGRMGLLFLVPGVGETLRINGRAAIIRDEQHLKSLEAGGQLPWSAIAVEVEECYLQCAKALLRSQLWEPHARPDLKNLPCAAQMFADQAKMPEWTVDKVQESLDGAYQRLY